MRACVYVHITTQSQCYVRISLLNHALVRSHTSLSLLLCLLPSLDLTVLCSVMSVRSIMNLFAHSRHHRWYAISCHCNALQHTATHYNTLQHTATHCNTLQCVAVARDCIPRCSLPCTHSLAVSLFGSPALLCTHRHPSKWCLLVAETFINHFPAIYNASYLIVLWGNSTLNAAEEGR